MPQRAPQRHRQSVGPERQAAVPAVAAGAVVVAATNATNAAAAAAAAAAATATAAAATATLVTTTPTTITPTTAATRDANVQGSARDHRAAWKDRKARNVDVESAEGRHSPVHPTPLPRQHRTALERRIEAQIARADPNPSHGCVDDEPAATKQAGVARVGVLAQVPPVLADRVGGLRVVGAPSGRPRR